MLNSARVGVTSQPGSRLQPLDVLKCFRECCCTSRPSPLKRLTSCSDEEIAVALMELQTWCSCGLWRPVSVWDVNQVWSLKWLNSLKMPVWLCAPGWLRGTTLQNFMFKFSSQNFEFKFSASSCRDHPSHPWVQSTGWFRTCQVSFLLVSFLCTTCTLY